MRKQIKLLLLVALSFAMTAPAWGQASTQGKEFWVSSTIVCSPNSATATPYIAVSAETACTVTITGGVGNAINITKQVAAGSWTEFNQNNGLDASKWYPVSMNNASNVRTLAGQTNDYGLHITATENISVYVILSSTNSMDASNILPINALGSDYYTQDYWPIVKSGFSNVVTVTTILATEDGTEVEISPKGTTYDNHSQPYTINLNQGQTYYLMSEADKQLSGTHIVAKDDKKIAIFCGVPLTNLPTNIAARDCLFEQPMPTNYWGTQFIVTRSMQKNGNLIGITAMQNGTKIKVDGFKQATINEGDTYYIMLQSSNDPNGRDPGTRPADLVITADDAYIETSCPCAVYNYDTGNSYRGANGDEIVNSQGDPSSVWVSPIQQKISKITFGTCYTSKTQDHFLNVVTETATCQQTKLTAFDASTSSTSDYSSKLTWTPVAGNPAYSYARAKIGDTSSKKFSVFRMENPRGFIANIYGNGNDESYAYSAGSAAVEYGVSVDGYNFANGDRSNEKFCLNSEMVFDASVGSNTIERVDWDFGDGITEADGPTVNTHTYTSPGWYDVSADLYGHQACTSEASEFIGRVQFSFRIVRQDTVNWIPQHECLTLQDVQKDPEYAAWLLTKTDSIKATTPAHCYDTVYQYRVIFGMETEIFDSISAIDSYYEPLTGKTYPLDPDNPNDYHIDLLFDAQSGLENEYNCPLTLHRHIDIKTCLDLIIENKPESQTACYGKDKDIMIPFTHNRGDIGYTHATIEGKDVELLMNGSYFKLPVEDIRPGYYKTTILVADTNCDKELKYPIDYTIRYSDSIFAYKFNNVLAVYKNGFGGNDGYEFTHYEWHLVRDDQDAVIGTDQSVLYLGQGITFEEEDRVYVVLTDNNGMTLRSCEKTIDIVNDYSPKPAGAPQKVIRNQRMFILHNEQMYDMYGQRVQ